MRATLSSYWLVGIDAVPVEVRLAGDAVRVVEPEIGRILHSVTLDTTLSAGSILEHVVNVCAFAPRRSAPAI